MSYGSGRPNLEPDIHGCAKRVRNALIQINHRDMSKQDRQDIIKFSTLLLGYKGLNIGRVAKYIYSLKVIAKFLHTLDPGITFRFATKERIEQFYLHIVEEATYTPHTKRDYHHAKVLLPVAGTRSTDDVRVLVTREHLIPTVDRA